MPATESLTSNCVLPPSRFRRKAPAVRAGLVMLAAGLVTGCAAGAGSGSGARPASNPNYITLEDMQAASASNAYDAVQRLRPRWLQSRGERSALGQTQIVVAVNGTYFGDLNSLRQFSVEELDGLSYIDSGAAASVVRGVGPGVNVEAAIVVELRGSGG